MSHTAFSHIRDNSQTRGSVKSVLLMIADYANDENGWKCYPGIARLARDTGFSERTVRKAVSTAKELGELRVLRPGGLYNGKGQANLYEIVSDFHRQDSPEDQGQDSPVVGEPGTHHRQNLPPPPADSVSPQADVAPPQADLAAQPLVEPGVKEPEDQPEVRALSPEYRTFVEKCQVWNDDEEPENSGRVEEEFTQLLEEGYSVGDLIAAYRGASTTDVTDLTEILIADRIKDFLEADPISMYRRKVAV